MISTVTNTTPATDAAAASTASAALSSTNRLVSKEAFLQLLVAQIKNQDPLNPADGTQFMSQLAQFSELEQMINMNAQLESISKALTVPATSDSSATAASEKI